MSSISLLSIELSQPTENVDVKVDSSQAGSQQSKPFSAYIEHSDAKPISGKSDKLDSPESSATKKMTESTTSNEHSVQGNCTVEEEHNKQQSTENSSGEKPQYSLENLPPESNGDDTLDPDIVITPGTDKETVEFLTLLQSADKALVNSPETAIATILDQQGSEQSGALKGKEAIIRIDDGLKTTAGASSESSSKDTVKTAITEKVVDTPNLKQSEPKQSEPKQSERKQSELTQSEAELADLAKNNSDKLAQSNEHSKIDNARVINVENSQKTDVLKPEPINTLKEVVTSQSIVNNAVDTVKTENKQPNAVSIKPDLTKEPSKNIEHSKSIVQREQRIIDDNVTVEKVEMKQNSFLPIQSLIKPEVIKNNSANIEFAKDNLTREQAKAFQENNATVGKSFDGENDDVNGKENLKQSEQTLTSTLANLAKATQGKMNEVSKESIEKTQINVAIENSSVSKEVSQQAQREAQKSIEINNNNEKFTLVDTTSSEKGSGEKQPNDQNMSKKPNGNGSTEQNRMSNSAAVPEIGIEEESGAATPLEQLSRLSREQTTMLNQSLSAYGNTVANEQAKAQYNDLAFSQTTQEIAASQKKELAVKSEQVSVYHKDFADTVKEKVMVMIHQNLRRVDIQLDPPELGNVQVRVNLQNEQAAVSFVVQNQQAKEAFEQNLDKLKNMLSESGVDVGDANVAQQNDSSNTQDQDDHQQGDPAFLDSQEEMNTAKLSNLIKASSTGVDYYA